ncbi:MAG: translation initiation factor eIF-2B [Ignavibacteria bacterium]|jgi:translation initiation factor 2B subunit (eIF-2B alpha/beta/delta family)|nr:translation initiation factor eIF-2B [Ignavibacteria bacterium]MDH7526732.1 hypothetical protein [Ignavibacteria bacterium]
MPETIKSLLKSLSPKTYNSVKGIISDYFSGSQELNEKILLLLLKSRSVKTLKNLILIFRKVFTQFAAILYTLGKVEQKLEKSNLEDVKSYIRALLNQQELRIQKLYGKFRRKISKGIRILTFSNSYTCFKLFEKIQSEGFDPEFYIPVSNPGGEGKLLFIKLKQLGAKCILIQDKEIERVISEVDIVITGADKIIQNKYFINKLGTKRLASLAKKHSKPFYLIALKEKVLKEGNFTESEKTPLRKKDKLLFERVEIAFVTEIFIA